MSAKKISPAEWNIMRVLWSKKQATSQEMVIILGPQMNWQPTTIKTMLSRLVKKGIVGTRKMGNRNIYFPTISETDTVRKAYANISEHICARKMGKYIVNMIKEHPLSYNDLKMIEEALKEKAEFAMKEVLCDCPPGQCQCVDCNCNSSNRKYQPTTSNCCG